MLIEYKNQIDFKCDYCTSKLSDFIDQPQTQPKSVYEAAQVATVFGWKVQGVSVKCPTCA